MAAPPHGMAVIRPGPLMAWSFRRSLRLGPFRLNLSKSGLGASVGVKGARVVWTGRARGYVADGRGAGSTSGQRLSTSTGEPRGAGIPSS
jgi:hypothetical protein